MKDQFLVDLKALMEKHNVEIDFMPDLGSDTHGFTGEMVISRRVGKTYKYEKIFSTSDWGITHHDL